MRLVVLNKTHLAVYEGTKLLAQFEIVGEFSKEELESVRLGTYESE